MGLKNVAFFVLFLFEYGCCHFGSEESYLGAHQGIQALGLANTKKPRSSMAQTKFLGLKPRLPGCCYSYFCSLISNGHREPQSNVMTWEFLKGTAHFIRQQLKSTNLATTTARKHSKSVNRNYPEMVQAGMAPVYFNRARLVDSL